MKKVKNGPDWGFFLISHTVFMYKHRDTNHKTNSYTIQSLMRLYAYISTNIIYIDTHKLNIYNIGTDVCI